jgi:hypothetical protein
MLLERAERCGEQVLVLFADEAAKTADLRGMRQIGGTDVGGQKPDLR